MKPVIGMTFEQMLDEAGRRLQEEEARVAAMTPEQRKTYAIEQAAKAREVEALLTQLRGAGFAAMKVRR